MRERLGAKKPMKKCPPPLVRRSSDGRCVKPFTTPFGGPASGLWPSGSVPTPPIACVTTDIFRDCFQGCMGTISGASPGPVCGWTFSEAFGAFGGRVVFTPGVMSFVGSNGEAPADTKPLLGQLQSIFNITGQYSFTEFQTP